MIKRSEATRDLMRSVCLLAAVIVPASMDNDLRLPPDQSARIAMAACSPSRRVGQISPSMTSRFS